MRPPICVKNATTSKNAPISMGAPGVGIKSAPTMAVKNAIINIHNAVAFLVLLDG